METSTTLLKGNVRAAPSRLRPVKWGGITKIGACREHDTKRGKEWTGVAAIADSLNEAVRLQEHRAGMQIFRPCRISA